MTASPICVFEWLQLSGLSIDALSSDPESGYCFDVRLSDGRALQMRADTLTQRALWVREMLRLASWRAVRPYGRMTGRTFRERARSISARF